MGQENNISEFKATPITQRRAEAEKIFRVLAHVAKVVQEEKKLAAQVDASRPTEPSRIVLVERPTHEPEKSSLIWLP